MKKLTSITALAAITALAGTAAHALKCGPRDHIATQLALQYGEIPVSGGLHGQKHILELFVSDGNSTWTILITKTDGIACVLAAGTEWIDQGLLPAGIPG